jgi:uncharacterized protein
MMRTSSYTIYVELPDSDEEVLLVHGYTGAYDRVSREVADFLRSREVKSRRKPLYGDWSPEPEPSGPASSPAQTTLDLLAEQGYLTELSCAEEESFFSRLATALHARALRQPPSYIFMPTYDCNLRCSYCFQDHMRTDCSFKHLLRSMQPAMIERIFAALPRIEERHGLDADGSRRRNIGLFGGEPLLAANRRIVEHILACAFAAGEADVWAVTNGTEIDAYRDLLGPGGIATLQITLDGPPREHDRRRVYADGAGSYDRIAANVTMALERGAAVVIRLNVDRKNLIDLPAVAAEIVARGWDRHPRFSAYTAPIHGGNGKTDRRDLFSSWELDQELTRMRAEHPNLAVLARPDEALRARSRRIFETGGSVLPSLRPSFCSAHDQMYIFDPFGDIYACWERTGDPDVRIGRVLPDGDVELKMEQFELWRSRTVASNPICRRCRYALHCGGGCAVLALSGNGKFHSNYCDGFAARFRASVAESYLAHVAGAPAAVLGERVCDL